MVISALTPTLYRSPPRLLARYGPLLLILLATSYAADTLLRNAVLGGVGAQTRSVLSGLTRLVPDPKPGTAFLLTNQPGLPLDAGYSMYGYRGVGTLTDSLPYSIWLQYGRKDLSAVLLDEPQQITVECRRHPAGQPLQALEWLEGNLQRLESSCPGH